MPLSSDSDKRDPFKGVAEWKLFNSIDTLVQERREAIELAELKRKATSEQAERERQERIASLTAEQSSLNAELSNLKGLFTGKRRKEIETRLAEIDAELKKLQ